MNEWMYIYNTENTREVTKQIKSQVQKSIKLNIYFVKAVIIYLLQSILSIHKLVEKVGGSHSRHVPKTMEERIGWKLISETSKTYFT